MLNIFDRLPALVAYEVAGQTHELTVVKLVIAGIIIIFALFNLLPSLSNLAFERKYLPLGGALSGFFGGLSGNQGALRSAFLIKAGLGKEAFIGTGVVSAAIVDIARLLVYGVAFYSSRSFVFGSDSRRLVLAATLAANE